MHGARRIWLLAGSVRSAPSDTLYCGTMLASYAKKLRFRVTAWLCVVLGRHRKCCGRYVTPPNGGGGRQVAAEAARWRAPVSSCACQLHRHRFHELNHITRCYILLLKDCANGDAKNLVGKSLMPSHAPESNVLRRRADAELTCRS
jgi:hypothetical protein